MITKDTVRNAVLGWVADPSHAWLAVDVTKYHNATDFADSYCYWLKTGSQGWVLLLEEDCCAPALLNGWEFNADEFADLAYYHDTDVVRSLPSFQR